MANNGPGGTYPYHYDDTSNRPDLKHQVSSLSEVSSASGHTGHRDSTVSLPSPTEEHARSNMDEVDISRVRLASIPTPHNDSSWEPAKAGSGSGSGSRRSSLIPDTLRGGNPTSPSSFNPFRSPTQAYEPITSPSSSRPSSGSGKFGTKRLSKRRSGSRGSFGKSHGAIPEEEIDMSLLSAAMPMAYSKQKTSYTTVDEEEEDSNLENVPILSPMYLDVSSYLGPPLGPPQNEEQVKEFARQEAAGKLTGGLGAGLEQPATTITSTDLINNAPALPKTPSSISRRMSFRRSVNPRVPSFRNSGLARKATVRELGQAEANKRGKIIEVIVEEEAETPKDPAVEEEPTFDISSFAGGRTGAVDFEQMDKMGNTCKNTLPAPTTEVFYPQPNWKPFSMRWPYLSGLIIISVVLAAAQEYLLHKGALYQFVTAQSLSTWNYFTFKYLPTLVAVTFGVLWQVTDFEVKRLEAYYQLSKDGGALAAESINVDYITFFNFLRPVRAFRYKHYAVAVSSIATLMAVSLVPTLQAASVELTPDLLTRQQDPSKPKEIRINAVWSRFLSVFLVIIAMLGCVLLWQLERRPSGLVADVKGIAGIAAMANRSHILMDFKNMDTANPELIHQTLKSHRYSLRNSSLAPEFSAPLTQEEKDKYDARPRTENPHPLMLRLEAGIPFIISMILFTILIPIVLFQPAANTITDKAPWFLTALAVCIKLAWGTLETDVRMIEPFYILSRRHASPKVLTLDYTAMAFGWMPIRAFLNGHYLIALVGFGSVLAEVLTICSTSFANVFGIDFTNHPSSPPAQGRTPRSFSLLSRFLLGRDSSGGQNAGEETFLSFWLSFALALSILTYLILISSLVYVRRRHPFLPRQPNSIASILAFIHQSKMLYDFVGTEKMNNDEMVERLGMVGKDGIGGKGKRYGLGWFVGRDGEVHCGVDEEVLLGGYSHGGENDVRMASMPWNTQWENY